LMYKDLDLPEDQRLAHYLAVGWKQFRDPSGDFDTDYFLRTRGHGSVCPLVRYLDETPPLAPVRSPEAVTLRRPDASGQCELPRLVVHVHAFYPELAPELLEVARNVPRIRKLVVTVCHQRDAATIRSMLDERTLASAEVHVVENRGRDIAPMLELALRLDGDFDYLLHLHTKRSPHVGFGDAWRRHLVRHIGGHREVALAACRLLAEDRRIALLYPENYFRIRRFVEWGNETRIIELLAALGFRSTALPVIARFPAGSMGWYSRDLLMTVATRFTPDSFEAEHGQLDLTLAHVLERAFPLIAAAMDRRVVAASLDTELLARSVETS
jgi:lipopolysaccharide biosynthesis protein